MDFVKRIKSKLSRQQHRKQAPEVGGGSPDLLQTIIQACQEMAASEANDPGAVARAIVAELVLPKVLSGPQGSRVNHEAAKAYAMACGQLVGMLAGLSLVEDAINPAIDEVLAQAKLNARATVEILKKHGFSSSPLVPKKSGTISGVSPAEQSKQDMTTQALAMIDDLERQALAEQAKGELASAAALRSMATTMKKELFANATEDRSEKGAA